MQGIILRLRKIPAPDLPTVQNMSNGTSFSDGTQYELLVQSVVDYALFMLNPQGRVISWNKGAERIKGYTRDEIIGQHFSAF